MDALLSLKNISKSFPGVKAVDNVSLQTFRGEVLALLGENGAGKSTLMKIICGVLKADRGEIICDGEPVQFGSSRDAMNSGINVVHQELSLVGSLSIAENIFMSVPPLKGINRVDWDQLNGKARILMDKFGLNLQPGTLVKNLSMGQQQMVEILKAVSTSPRVLILDEPTSSLTDGETEDLFRLIRKLKKDEVSLIYITHKLSEVFQIAEKAFIMRDGRYVSEALVADTDEDYLISQMVGREVKNLYGQGSSGTESSDEILRVSGMNRAGSFSDIDFYLNCGEILGFSGLVGAGRTEMALSLFGAEKKDSGTVIIKGKELKIRKPADAIGHGLAYLTEDRKHLGLYLKDSVKDNIIAPNLGKLTPRRGIIDRKAIRNFVNGMMHRYNVAATSGEQKIGTLSGGNQQKCLYSMWIGTEPDILILDEPTRGIDVGAREEMYANIRSFVEEGGAVILISSDMPEIMGLSDRIIVMHEGRISGSLTRDDFTEEKILSLAAGIAQEV